MPNHGERLALTVHAGAKAALDSHHATTVSTVKRRTTFLADTAQPSAKDPKSITCSYCISRGFFLLFPYISLKDFLVQFYFVAPIMSLKTFPEKNTHTLGRINASGIE